jgi:hypothetical protein
VLTDAFGKPTIEVAAMNHENQNGEPVEQKTQSDEYEAPAIESVMTPEDLTREVQYAGIPFSQIG